MIAAAARAGALPWLLALLVAAAVGCGGTKTTPDGGTGGRRDGGAPDGGIPGSGGRGGRGGTSGGAGGSTVSGSGGSSGAATGGRGAGGAGGTFSGAGGASAGSGGHPGTGGAPGPCDVALTLDSPASERDIEPGPAMKMRLRAVLGNSPFGTTTLHWQWHANAGAVSGPALSVVLVGGDPTLGEVPVETAGSYFVRVDVDDGPGGSPTTCTSMPHIFTAQSRQPTLLIRVSPPTDSGYPPDQEFQFLFNNGNDVALVAPIKLEAGQQMQLTARKSDGLKGFLPAYLRVSSKTGPWRIEGYTGNSGWLPVVLVQGRTYDLLAVPDDDVAPLSASLSVVPGSDPDLLLDPGVPVSGTVAGPDGEPVEGARVVLRAGTRPSTVGVTDDAGIFQLLARPGVHAVAVTPPQTLGWPDARTSGDSGLGQAVTVDATGAPELAFRFARIDFARVELAVRGAAAGGAGGSGGSEVGPLAGAHVHVRAVEAPSVGTLTAGPSLTLQATGAVVLDGDADAAGGVVWPAVPLGRYRFTVTPPAGGDALAAVTTEIEVQADVVRTIDVPPMVRLSGRIGPLLAAVGARVVAIDPSADVVARAATATVDAAGGFTLAVDPGRSYRITVDPVLGAPVGRAVMPMLTMPASGDLVAPPFTLPQGLSVTGVVMAPSPASRPVAGALIQVFCAGQPSSCPDRAFSYAETVTNDTGGFQVVVPASIGR